MAFEDEKLEALTILLGIVQGTMTVEEAFEFLDKAEDVLVYFILKYIKKHYHRDHDDFDEVRPRLNNIRTTYRSLTRKAKAGEEDAVVEWFEGTHRYSELSAEDFIDLVVEKLES